MLEGEVNQNWIIEYSVHRPPTSVLSQEKEIGLTNFVDFN